MTPEFKSFEFELKDADENSGMICGYASTFGNIDQGGDVVDKGAFKQSIKSTKGLFPILADHDPAKQIGWNLRAEEDEKGLYVEGRLNMQDPYAMAKYGLIKMAIDSKAKMGLSIGYNTIKAIADKENPTVRRLKEVKIWEYSVVAFPMNVEALVTAAKSFNSKSNTQDAVNAAKEIASKLGLEWSEFKKALVNEPAALFEELMNEDEPTEVTQTLLQSLESLKL